MSSPGRVALIGFGEVGQRLAADLIHAGAHVAAYDILFCRPDSPPSAALKRIGAQAAARAEEAVKGADIVVSAVTAACDLDAARSVVPALARGSFYLDVNSVSPGMKQACAKLIENAQARYVEAAVMTPIAPRGIASAMLLGGPHARAFIERARPLGFSGASAFSDVIGRASATKMCRSVIIKGLESLLCESMLAARHYGVDKVVLDSLSDLLPLPDWGNVARYFISRALEHGRRRAEEMRESAQTVREAGVEPLMAAAAARREDWAAVYRSALAHADDLGAMIDAIRDQMQSPATAAKAAE